MSNSIALKTLTLLVLLGLAACTPPASKVAWQSADADWVFPEPPEAPRIRYLRQVSNRYELQKGSAGRSVLKWLGGEQGPELPLVAPYGVTADGFGRIWLADPGSSAVHIFDLGRKKLEYLSALEGRQLMTPVGVAFDGQRQRLYVSDAGLLEVLIFDNDANYIKSLRPSRGFGRPGGLALDVRGQLYVADVTAGEVAVFSAEGEYLRSLGSQTTANGKFNRPSNLAVDREGRIYVVDALHFRVEVLGLPGEPATLIGGLGSVAGLFARPRGVALDARGHVYVSDAAFDNIQVFNRQGELLLVIGSSEPGAAQFCMPAGMYFDPADRLYVADSCGYRVKIFEYIGD